MLYQISSDNINDAIIGGAFLICKSTDNSNGLVSYVGEDFPVSFLEKFEHTEINELLMLDFWKQEPCDSCGI